MASQRSCGAFLMAGPSKACFRKGQTAKKDRAPKGPMPFYALQDPWPRDAGEAGIPTTHHPPPRRHSSVSPGPESGPGLAFWADFASPLQVFGPGLTVEGEGGYSGRL